MKMIVLCAPGEYSNYLKKRLMVWRTGLYYCHTAETFKPAVYVKVLRVTKLQRNKMKCIHLNKGRFLSIYIF